MMNKIYGGEYELPKWVKLVMWFANGWDSFFYQVSMMTQWRWKFKDNFCYCEKCLERRRMGKQEPGWTWKNLWQK